MNQTTLYVADVAVKCSRCGVKFNTRQLPVLLDTGYRNSELRQDFKGAVPQFEQYAVTTCPGCGMADWVNRFAIVDEATVFVQPNVTPHLMFRTAAVTAEREGRDFFNIGLFYLHAAWCADDINALPQAREYRMLAADAFSKSLVDGTCPMSRRVEIEYLIGELLRRAGAFEQSRNQFRQAMPKLSSRFALMARKLMRFAENSETKAIDFEMIGG